MAPPASYNLFSSYPATGPLTGNTAQIDPTAYGVKVILNGTAFSAQVQISNAAPPYGVLPHLFAPAETDWEEQGGVQTAADGPLSILAPCRFVRVKLLSGALVAGNVAESFTQGSVYGTPADARQELAGQIASQVPGLLAPLNREVVRTHENDPDAHSLAVVNDRIITNTASITLLLNRPQKSFTRVAYDDFNRTAGALGSAVLGGTWIAYGSGLPVINGTAAISANTASVTAINGGLLPTRTSDQRVTMTQQLVGATGQLGILARFQDDTNCIMVVQDVGSIIVYDVVGGTQTARATYLVAPLAGDVLAVEVVGKWINVLLNDVQLGSVTTTLLTGTSAGFRLSGTAAADDIEITSEAGSLLRQVQSDSAVFNGPIYTLLAKDTFTAADGTPLTTHTTDVGGYAWTAIAGAATITGNALSTPTALTLNLLAATAADAAVTQDMTLGTGDAWIYFRFNAGTNTGLLFQRTVAGVLEVLRQVGGPTTTLYTLNIPNPAGPERMTVIGIGSTISVLLNGVVVLTFMDATSQTVATHGIRRGGNASVDNFRVMKAEVL